MERNALFDVFDAGELVLSERTVAFSALPWNNHPKFAGVSLKHLITAADSGGAFSYHLVKIEAGKAIGDHTHATQLETHEVVGGIGTCLNNGVELSYCPGVLSIFPAGVPHSVTAGDAGLLLFAKFMPAL